jgi:outer membrane protein, heavy metal efflux system
MRTCGLSDDRVRAFERTRVIRKHRANRSNLRMSRAALLLAITLLTSACTTYRAEPLEEQPALLSPPVAAVLARDSVKIDRPYLKATTLDLAKPLDANDIAILAVIANPDLKVARLQANVASAQSFAARLLPDPSFNLGEDFRLSGPDQLNNLVAALGLDLNALRTHAVVSDKARADEQQVRLDLAWAEWQTAGKARIGAVRTMSLERAVTLNRASRDAAQELLDASVRAAGRGDLPADQVQAMRTAAFDAAERLRTSERDLATARSELAKLLGLPPDSPLQLRPDALPEAALDAAGLFELAQTRRADLQALRAGYASQEATVHKAVLDQFPKLDLTITATRDTTGNRLVGPNVGMTLPLWNRNRGGIAVQRATRAALKAEYETRLFETRADIAAAVDGIAIARRQRRDILAGLPALERFVQGSAAAASRGDLSSAVAATTAQALRDKQTQLTQSEQDIQEQWIALELLTGTLLGESER